MTLKNGKALVTGGCRGIGRAIALALAGRGVDVGVNYHKDRASALDVVEIVEIMGRSGLAIQADVSAYDSVKEMIDIFLDHFGEIDFLVNNAGILLKSPLENFSLDDWERVMDVNLKGAFLCSKMVGKQMIKAGGGNIVNISSIAAFNPEINLGSYSVSKAGLNMLTRLMAVERGNYNIRVNAVCPGPIDTPMLRAAFDTPELFKARVEALPLKRLGKPEDVAKAVIFLLSDDARNITGECLVTDGGSHKSMYYLIDRIGGEK
jgi:3-oxoacyl-[acyl-carrier protein] reductase